MAIDPSSQTSDESERGDEEFTTSLSQSPTVEATAPSRYLLAWLNDQMGVMSVLGHPAQPGEDTVAATTALASARAARAARSPWVTRDPRVPVDRSFLSGIASRDDIQAAFAPHIWEPAFIDLTAVLSVQQMVNLQGLDARVAGDRRLEDICLPGRGMERISCSADNGGAGGFTISSPNPNLRVTGAALSVVTVAPGDDRQAVQIFFGVTPSFVQVAEYRGRFFLRDGYHRAVGLLRKSVTQVPAILIHARTMSELTPLPGLLGEDVLFDSRPAALTDFLDDSVSYTGQRRSTRKFIRVRAEEFNH